MMASQKNNLFSYFTKKNGQECPKKQQPKKEEKLTNGAGNADNDRSVKRARGVERARHKTGNRSDHSDEDSEIDDSKENSPQNRSVSSKRSGRRSQVKRRRIIESDSGDSEDDYQPPPASSSSESSGVESEGDSSPVQTKKRKRSLPAASKKGALQEFSSPSSGRSSLGSTPSTPASSFTPSVSNKTKSKLATFAAPDAGACDEARVFPHSTLDFLRPDRIKDVERRGRDHPEYDPRTLHVPESFLAKQTPAMRQWWQIKSAHYDAVLFFKMGKFYELFHMDADVGVTQLSLIYMKGEYAHAGFPEIAFGRYSETLIQKGYKIARIEQTETPDMMQERCRKMNRTASKFDKVVRREVCSVQTSGTRRYSFIDGDSSGAAHSFLLALCQRDDPRTVGVCFIDSSIGTFHVGQFTDDRHFSRLATLLSHYPPVQVLYERGQLSDQCSSLLSGRLSCLREPLKPGSEFWDGAQTLKSLLDGGYFSGEGGAVEWPPVIRSMTSQSDTLGLSPAEDAEMALSALGAVVWYLRQSLIDEELLSMRQFELYTPVDATPGPESGTDTAVLAQRRMVLDAVTLTNLEVIQCSGGGQEGSLLHQLDRCHTPFGRRLLTQWLCAPLCNPASIDDRLSAIEDLHRCPSAAAEAGKLMRKLPDLDRLLSRIHTLGSERRSQDHPDSRAIFFEDVTYSKRKIEDFLSALDGFKVAVQIMKEFEEPRDDFRSRLLRQTVGVVSDSRSDAHFPDLTQQINFFENAFDQRKAQAEGVIKPSPGVAADYDAAVRDMQLINQQLDQYLNQQKSLLGAKSLVYWGSGKNRFQMEIPDHLARNVPHNYEMTSSKKGHKRYRTPHIEGLLSELTEAEDRRDAALRDVMRNIFSQFDAHFSRWSAAVQCLSVLDVLLSLAEYSQGAGLCRPTLLPPTGKPLIRIRGGRHPCITQTFSGDFIPNDTVIGTDDDGGEFGSVSRLVLVTGPNMGGKSTLMRQVGCLVILAHLGCYVPAERCEMTPVDRVFTRLGASDRIMAGESTFLMELSETAAILQHATPHSLVLLDELGRGTATFDGTAIACSVVQELSSSITCRTLFSTHYHSLVEEFAHDPNISLGHMACMVENEEDPSEETITFLYKFAPGACPKSYGFNAARLANVPEEVIRVAVKKAREFEASGDRVRRFRSLCGLAAADSALLPSLLSALPS